jgi:hypothetical protein
MGEESVLHTYGRALFGPDPIETDHQSWLMRWLVENRPKDLARWWYIVPQGVSTDDDDWDLHGEVLSESGGLVLTDLPWKGDEAKEQGSWVVLDRNYKTLGGTSGFGNYFVVGVPTDEERRKKTKSLGKLWSAGREDGRYERLGIMGRLEQGYEDETVGIEVDTQFFLENQGWYLAKIPEEDDRIGLFYRGVNSFENGIVVTTASDLMPMAVTKTSVINHNRIDVDSIRFLNENDSWIVGPPILKVLNWSDRFPTRFFDDGRLE